MRIAHFPSNFIPAIGGAEITVHNVALHQREAGHQVTVISPSWRTGFCSLPYRTVPLIPRSMQFFLKVKRDFGFDLRRLVAAQLVLYQWIYRFDVWHVHMPYPAGVVAVPALKRLRVAAVVTCHGSDIQMLPEIGYGLRLDPAVDRDITDTIQAFERVTAVSASMRSEFLKMGVAPEKIRDIPNGVDASRIRSLQVDRNKVRTKLGWPTDKAIILTVGHNRPVKGHKFIPEIIEHIAAARSDFLWIIVGHNTDPIVEMARQRGLGGYLQTIPEIGLDAKQLGISISPRFLGRLRELAHSRMGGVFLRVPDLPSDELIGIYRAADIFVFPSMLEAFGMVQLEAMAAGLPVITTDAPGCRDVVEHGITGLRSPVGDTLGMAENILRLLADPSLRATFGRKGQAQSACYEWRNIAAQYCTVYEELVSSR